MLFDLFIGALETVCDVIQYGPLEAMDIARSGCPEAERATREIMQSISKSSETASSSVEYQANDRINRSGNTEFNKEYETCLEESEEEIIRKAVAEKSCW